MGSALLSTTMCLSRARGQCRDKEHNLTRAQTSLLAENEIMDGYLTVFQPTHLAEIRMETRRNAISCLFSCSDANLNAADRLPTTVCVDTVATPSP